MVTGAGAASNRPVGERLGYPVRVATD